MKKSDNSWIYTVTILAFLLTILFSTLSEFILSGRGIALGIITILIFVLIGVIFDMIGVATTTSSHSPFHAMASKKVSTAKIALYLVKNSARVSSFCNDVIGDVCGIMSGSAGLLVATSIANKYDLNSSLLILMTTSIIAALTIGGKAFGKGYAIKNNSKIVNRVAKILSIFKRK